MQVFAGEFLATSGTGLQAITGVGFIPNAIIFTICSAGGDDAWSGDAFWGHGFATATGGAETKYSGGSCRDARTSGGAHTRGWNDDDGIRAIQWGGAVVLDFDVDSFDADGFTIDKATGGVYKVKFLAILCDEAFVGSLAVPLSTGDNAETGVGFRPDLLITAGFGSTGASVEPFSQSNPSDIFGATDGTQEFCRVSYGTDTGNTEAQTRFEDDSVYFAHVNDLATITERAVFTSFDADGFTLDFTSISIAKIMSYLCLKDAEGFAVKADLDSAASTGDEVVTGIGQRPRGLILESINSPTVGSQVLDASTTLGFGDESLNENSVAGTDEDNAASGQVDQFIDTDDIFHGGAVGGTSVRVADLQTMNADGFTINWASVSGSVRIAVIAFGSSLPPPFEGSLRGRHLIMPFRGAHRGRHRVINVFDQSLRGRTKTAFDTFDLSLRGRSRVSNVYDQAMRGRYEIQLLLSQSLRGRNKTEGPALVLFNQSLRGVHGVQQEYNQSLKAMNRIANDAIDLFELWIRADVEPDLTTAPTETFVSLPHTTAALAPPLSGTRKYFLVLRKRNQYNLSSENISFWAVTVDSAGAEVVVAPSAPAEYAVAPAEAINANVTAEYFYLPDGDNQADTWAIFLTSNGVNPDLAGAPFTTVAMQKVDGLAKFDEDLGPFIEGDTVKVIVTTRRGAVQSVNNEIVETIVTALGPAKVDADIHLGDQAGISSTEGDNHG